jgi:hypothetical protein
MNQTCGTPFPAVASGSARYGRRAATVCAVALATVACSLAAAGTARAEPLPQPQKLWQAYPLDPKPSPPVRATATTPHPRLAPTTTGNTRSHAEWYAATGISAALLALATLGAALLRWGGGAAPAGAASSVRRPGSAGARLTVRRQRAAERLMTGARGMGRWPLPRARPQHISSGRSSSADGSRSAGVPARDPIPPAVVTQPRPLMAVPVPGEDAVRAGTTPPPRHGETDEKRLDGGDVLLKRKTARAEAEAAAKLKAARAKKAVAEPLRVAEDPAPSDVELLKAKLADERETPVAPDPAPASAQVIGAPAIAPAKPPQPEPSVASVAPRRPATPRTTAVCRIEWWRGYMTSEFLATCKEADGTESDVLRSPSFRWRKSTPPPNDLAPAAAAHGTLVAQLEAAGWVVGRTRGDWYSLELHRPASVAVASKPKGVA